MARALPGRTAAVLYLAVGDATLSRGRAYGLAAVRRACLADRPCLCGGVSDQSNGRRPGTPRRGIAREPGGTSTPPGSGEAAVGCRGVTYAGASATGERATGASAGESRGPAGI